MSAECKEQLTKESNDSINKITLLLEKFDIERADINKNHSLQVKRLEEEITDIVADGETKYEKLRRSHDEEISAMTANFKEENRYSNHLRFSKRGLVRLKSSPLSL